MTNKTRLTAREQIICHHDGTYTYWSVYEQVWRARTGYLPDTELAAHPVQERARVERARRLRKER